MLFTCSNRRLIYLSILQVNEWGQLHVALNPDESKRDCSDALFLQVGCFSFLLQLIGPVCAIYDVMEGL